MAVGAEDAAPALEQAQAQVSLFLDVVQFFKGFNASLHHKNGVGSLSLRLDLAE